MKKLSNVKISDLRISLKALGLEKIRTKGGHEMWSKDGMVRPIVFQSHIEPVPEFILKNIMRTLGITKEEYLNVLNK